MCVVIYTFLHYFGFYNYYFVYESFALFSIVEQIVFDYSKIVSFQYCSFRKTFKNKNKKSTILCLALFWDL